MWRNKKEKEGGNVPEVVPAEDEYELTFDEKKHVPALSIVRTGLAIVANEMERMVRKSKRTGLNPGQAFLLKEYIRTCSDVAKKHKNLSIEFLTADEMETMPEARMQELMRQAIGQLDPDEMDMPRKVTFRPKAGQKVLARRNTENEN